MPRVRPFPLRLARPDLAAKLAAPPFDSLTPQEHKRLAAEQSLSFLNALPAFAEPPDDRTRDEALAACADWLAQRMHEGAYLALNKPVYLLYRLALRDHSQVGLVCEVGIDAYTEGLIKAHEHTREDKVELIVAHMQATGANAGPVTLMYPPHSGLDALIAKLVTNEPVIDFATEAGLVNTIWMFDDEEAIERITAAFSELDELYIADGHHRVAAAQVFAERSRASDTSPNGPKPYESFPVVLFPSDQLRILAFNRCIEVPPGLEPARILDLAKERFDVARRAVATPDEARPENRAEFSMFLEGTWYRLLLKPEYAPPPDPYDSLNVVILQEHVLGPIFGVTDPSDPSLEFVTGAYGMAELERRCRSGNSVAFAVFPTTVDELMAVAAVGKVMPPKSTYFSPKLRIGLIIRSLTD